ncbi:toll/interleukin-1 receptor domain-containing protein [Stutzerimonas kunmingensis]|uniref:toll/interleukin-1 receptor domain-containing protein n=1 Tax=Stutzerimonas kunmingensis TaxID=1211807 RepID=UPI000D05124C|nr:toll/interleukin-1 receptor domain-containing protein [Stutzerimonas kunmingensis]AWM58424.1 toll/interleukin-1 receptor domain-containing protein [Stutzerimonas stutzeri]
MRKKVFISYSHKDEAHREDLEDHLSMLKRKEIISIWHDRKIIPGDDWKGSIDENLDSADIIIFLVSPSFLASSYCLDVEVKRAIERHAEGSAKIISIIVRPCDWHECDFSKYQAVPKDAKAITLWENKDSAWLDAVTGLKKYITEFTTRPPSKEILQAESPVTVSVDFNRWLKDTEIVLSHRKVDKVLLSDIYVIPDVEFEREFKEKEINISEADTVYKEPGFYLILGEEQQGKTSFLKKAFFELASKGITPVYLDATGITKSDTDKLIEKCLTKQYDGPILEKLVDKQRKVALIDNLDEIGLNEKYRNIFLENLAKEFDWIICTCHSAFNYIRTEVPALSKYTACTLLGLGNFKREEIIRKWIALGVEESINENDLYSKCDELKSQLNTVIKRNIVPPKPIYVLMLMQMFEAYAQQNIELTSYGHCYQQLIYQSFEKAKINGREYEKYLNVLTEISWHIFKLGEGLNRHQIDNFFLEYEKTYLSVDKMEILEKLLAHSILSEKHGKIGFKYPYIYYFFVGKKIAEGFAEDPFIKENVDLLLERLHREDYANILIFITHHTKDSWVLNKINEVLGSLFQEQSCATLTKHQLSFMDDFMKKIPDLVLEQREIQNERDERNRSLDAMERDRSATTYDDADAPLDILSSINKSFKGMEIAGQIIRNRYATIPRDALYQLANSGAATGLRFLDYFIKISDSSKSEIIKVIEQMLSEHPHISDKEIEGYAQNTYLHLTYGVINGVVRKIASSIGSKEAFEVYDALSKQENTPAYTLINQAVQLQFTRSLHIPTIEQTKERLKNNPVCLRILKEMVIQHIYMFPVDYKEKQQLSSMLGISIRGQRLMDHKKAGKA